MAKIRLYDRNSREEKLSFQPDQPGGNFFWATTKIFAEKNSPKQDFFLLHSVIESNTKEQERITKNEYRH